jgi:hypothetical protein
LREEEKKEYTFIIRSNICERFFIQKERKISSVLCESSPKRKKEKKKKNAAARNLLSFHARFFALKRLCFITRAEAHIYINE